MEKTKNEKSILLAELCGWVLDWDRARFFPPKGFCYEGMHTSGWHINKGEAVSDLYHPANMALAWRVLNWAMDQHFWMDSVGGYFSDGAWSVIGNEETALLPPTEAQRLWLDQILELAIEAKMIQGANVAP